MIPINGLTITAIGVLLVIAGLTIVWLLIEISHERAGARMFAPAPADAAKLPKLPELPPDAPFPGDVPLLAAPVPEPEPEPEPAAVDDSTLWNLHKIEPGQVWALLRAEGLEVSRGG